MKNYADSVDMMKMLSELGPLPRTLACNATDEALRILKHNLGSGFIEGYETEKSVWSWKIPKRWEVHKAKITANGETLIDVQDHHLHLVNYSQPFIGRVSHSELQKHIHSDPNRPDTIPYIFKFYQQDWGFSIQHNKLKSFKSDFYDVEIDVSFEDGFLNVFYDYLPGENSECFVICSNVCHPTQVNDSLTGAVVGLDIFKRLKSLKKRKYSYLFLAVPETIGSIAFFANNKKFIDNSVGGFFSEMLGTDGPIVGQKTRAGDTYLDFLMEVGISNSSQGFSIVPFLKSASNDEKVLDSPGVDIPTFSISRAPYIEYHSSDDNVNIIKESCLRESRDILQSVIDDLENDYIPRLKFPGHIFLSGYDLYPNWYDDPKLLVYWNSFIDIMPHIDGKLSVIEVAKKVKCDPEVVFYWCDKFIEKGLAKKFDFVLKRADKSIVGF